MPRLHPYAEAIYSVVPLGDGSFGVEVIVPETNPTRVSGFATEIAAGAWIETHKRQVELNLPYRPTHAVKNGRRYRYYVSRPLIIGARADAAPGLRIPAAEI